MWEYAAIIWLYAWGAYATGMWLVAVRIIESGHRGSVVGPVCVALVWPLSVPYLILRIAQLLTTNSSQE